MKRKATAISMNGINRKAADFWQFQMISPTIAALLQ